MEGARKPTPRNNTSRIVCDAVRRTPWPLRWCLAVLVAVLLAWFIFGRRVEQDDAAKKAAIRAALGRGTWNMLHRLTVKYPKKPTSQQRQDVHEFFRLFSWHYPCEDVRECGVHVRLSGSPARAP